MILTWQDVAMALIAALPALLAAYYSRDNGKKLSTNSGLTIGQHIEGLQAVLAKVATAKTLDDAKLAAAALTAIAKLAAAGTSEPLYVVANAAAQALTDKADVTALVLAANPPTVTLSRSMDTAPHPDPVAPPPVVSPPGLPGAPYGGP